MTQPKFVGGLGFRYIELFNLALLARQACQILQEPTSLSARVLKAVYFPTGDILNASIGSCPLQIWRAIIEGRDVLKLGLIRRISNGQETDAWNQNWLPRDERFPPVAPRKERAPKLVSDYIDHTSASWRVDKLEEFFLPMDYEVIKGIPLCTQNQQDFWAWHHERTGLFSVRSAYRMLALTKVTWEAWLDGRPASSSSTDEGKKWAELWKVQVPSKMRIFLWRLAQHSLPTGDMQHHRNMVPSPICSLCGHEDSWRNSLIGCNMSHCIWALTTEEITAHISLSTEPSTKQWLFSMLDTVAKGDLTRMLVTLWAIWHARRKAIHKHVF
jgi:hypothetical protein